MKTMLCLIGLATLILTNGCASHRGGAYGAQEYQRGNYRGDPSAMRERGYYFDEDGHYHEYHGGTDHVYF